MARYVCPICGYVHDEAGSERFDDLPADWTCPICGAAKAMFEREEAGQELEADWSAAAHAYEEAHPQLAAEWKKYMEGALPDGWDRDIQVFPADPKGTATRVTSGTLLNDIAEHVPNLFGGSADLAPSNKTEVKGAADFQADAYDGRNLRFGVREHAMGSILNGMALHGGIIPYAGTFLVFSDYMRPAIRLAALMGLKVIYIFTHDSIALGEDGPTHQPIEHLASLRAISNLVVIRPCDANETAEAWRFAMTKKGGPVALSLTRQGLPVLARDTLAPAQGLLRGAYVLKETAGTKPDVILIGSGSEVHIALEACEILESEGISVRVVSMPSWELFDEQPQDYRESVLPPEQKARISIEAGSTQGWHRYVGESGLAVGIDRFGASAPYKVLYEKFGLTPERLADEARNLFKQG